MSPNYKQWLRQHWRKCFGVAAFLCLLLAAYAIAPYFGFRAGITNANGNRIVANMTKPEVEAILGRPNPLPDLARKGESFWDENTVVGCYYVAIHVSYNHKGQVVGARVSGFWRRPLWLFS
jgi:hypothetical protein